MDISGDVIVLYTGFTWSISTLLSAASISWSEVYLISILKFIRSKIKNTSMKLNMINQSFIKYRYRYWAEILYLYCKIHADTSSLERRLKVFYGRVDSPERRLPHTSPWVPPGFFLGSSLFPPGFPLGSSWLVTNAHIKKKYLCVLLLEGREEVELRKRWLQYQLVPGENREEEKEQQMREREEASCCCSTATA